MIFIVKTEMEDHTLFLNYVNDNYKQVQDKLKILCGRNKQRYNQDYLQESIIRCHNAIKKKGFLKDKTPYGIESYLIRAYFNLVREDKRAAINAKRDLNYNSDNISTLYEDWYNDNNVSALTKIASDLYKDFSLLYILLKVEENFDQEHSYLFKLKNLSKDMTYKHLSDKTHIKGCRQKVLEVKEWLTDNISKEEIKEAFNEIYGDLL
jgi:hypothetical protein